jgi:hypothetical protein
MKYKVVFRELSNWQGEKSSNPSDFLDTQLDEETVLDSRFVGRNRPFAQHSSDKVEEDDAFLSLGSEVWEYDVADGKDQAFKDALLNSGVVMEFEPLESGGEVGIG